VGDFLILDAVRASGGAAIAVDDAEMRAWTPLVGADTGIFCAPEGAATAVAAARLRQSGHIRPDDEVVLFNTGSGLKYVS
jgi:threonine synthase